MRKIYGIHPFTKNRVLGIIGLVFLAVVIIKIFVNLFF